MICNPPYEPPFESDFIKMTSPLDFVQRDDRNHRECYQRNVAEVEQTSEIRDNFGVMRFKVILQRAFP